MSKPLPPGTLVEKVGRACDDCYYAYVPIVPWHKGPGWMGKQLDINPGDKALIITRDGGGFGPVELLVLKLGVRVRTELAGGWRRVKETDHAA